MEIDPRLRSPGDNTTGGVTGSPALHHHAYEPTPQSAHSTTGGYPEVPSHVSPSDQFHSPTPSSSGHGYYGAVPHASHSYYPSEPAAIAGAPSHEQHHVDPDDPLGDLKRPRACEACRQLKVRCEPDDNHPTGACRRCAKAGRTCVVTAPTRKRQKKTDSRVAELEKKIDALTASLQATRGQNPVAEVGTPRLYTEEPTPRRWLGGGPPPRQGVDRRASRDTSVMGSPAHLAGNKRQHSGEFKGAGYGGFLAPQNPRSRSPQPEQQARDVGDLSGVWSSIFVPKPDAGHEFADVIDKGLVDVEIANKAFNRYAADMAPVLPFVVFPPGTKMGDIRRTKPILFLAILSVSISPFQPAIHLQLTNAVYRVIAERVLVKGEKTLELVQALLVACLWYPPPDHFEELKFYQLIHMAAILGMDIGMNRRTRTKHKPPFGVWREILGKKASSLDPDAPETRRAWAGCYFMALLSTFALRRALLVRWSPYMDECLDIFQNSPDALPSDRSLTHWLKLARIGEEVSFQFSMDDPVTSLSLHDPKVQYALKGFEKQMDQWRREIPSEFYSPTMRHFEQILNVYMHEIAMHVDHNIDDFRPPFVSSAREGALTEHTTPAHVDALTSCLTSIHESLDIMCSLDQKTILALPTIFFARTSYVAVALIKLFSATSAQDSRLGQVFDPADLKVEYYLDKVTQHFKVAGNNDGGRTVAKFAVVLSMLKNWFLKRKDHDSSREGSSQQRSSEKGDHDKPGTTPLHLLSEVAMDANNRPGSSQMQSQEQSQYPPPPQINGPGVTVGSALAQDQGHSVNTMQDTWSQYPPPPSISATSTSHQLYSQQPTAFQPPPGQEYPIVTAMDQPVYAGFVPELGMQVGFDADNLFGLGSILEDGFFDFAVDTNPNSF
ncbi:transcriptional regulator family: Fungal Specific TF [Paecilomyces variotii]|nr:transcriptional regulator family: Fungal Specific TF [Paecilomyces variotii]KAJ9303596.1 transcriptional regulator family: Fungal Specific TF [Paecilomyces variotii]